MIRCGSVTVIVLFLLTLWGCASPIRVEENTPPARRSYGVADYTAGTLSGKSINLLGNFMLSELYKKAPGQVLSRLEAIYRQENRPGIVAALADLALQTGYRFRNTPDESSSYFLASAFYSSCYLKYLDDTLQPYDEQRIRQIRIHNLAMTELFFYLKERNLERRAGFELPLPGSGGRKVRFSKPRCELPVGEEWIADFTPCANFKTVGLTHDTRVFGLGVPLVAELKEGARDIGGQMISGLPIAVTLVGDFDIDRESREITAVLRYVYSRTKEKITFGKREFPLAADFSTPLASAVGKPQDMNFIERTVKVSEAARITGLYHLEPYDDKRIPVVFVHGLMSDARTWSQMLNTLLHDPILRRKYQFLGFAYSSGNPIFVSGALLRRELNALRAHLVQQKRSTEAFDKMVLIGHSMGGLLSRLQVTSCNEALVLEKLKLKATGEFKKKLSPEELRKLQELINFAPAPFIKRVVFIAVPHRGSQIAMGYIARAGASLIRLPADLVRRNIEIFNTLFKGKKKEEFPLRAATGVDNLRPDNIMLQVLNSLEIPAALPYHSIMGNKDAEGIPGGSDGVVPYTSSHLDGAVSELVVKSRHSVQQNSLAIQEVRRILLLHVDPKRENKK